MPVLGTFGAASVRGFGRSIGRGYWISGLYSSSNDYADSIAIDGSNIYICGSSGSAGTDDILIAKYNTSGILQWQRRLGGSTADRGQSVAVDTSGNIYICGWSNIGGSNDIVIAKYSTSGLLQWQRILGASGTSERGLSVAVDSSGSSYISATGSVEDLMVVKYDTSGTLQWQRGLGGTDGWGSAVTVNNSGNTIYVCTDSYFDSSTWGAGLVVYNQSGTVLSQQRGWVAGAYKSVAVDNTANMVYTCGSNGGSIQIMKYSGSGTLLTDWVLTNPSVASIANSVTVDSSGNFYVCGNNGSALFGCVIIIAKFNPSGTLQWQRRLQIGGSSSYAEAKGIVVDSIGDFYICASYTLTPFVDQTSQSLIVKLPGDGSMIGTYTLDGIQVSYAASSLTLQVGTVSLSGNIPGSSYTSTFTSSTSSLTDAASSLTSIRVGL
jgi:hypothetical protein